MVPPRTTANCWSCRRSEEHTSELQSRLHLVCRLLLEKKNGALPTLIGAEYTFTFENMNIERGLLWNQENAVNRGIQLNYTHKKLTTAFSWNAGFYSNRYTWLFGSLAYAFNASNTLSFVAGGDLGGYDE